ncbi:Nif11-like leader peptide family natural product precursor [Desulfospira joergensenii]|uniref:Nif11-like leader peptide family natural product precursor n=1 Tax=Desulfospira joergensenii TaxID=53329 RepID=UPI0003B4F7F3|nr:Nif11-like leader peptide family natural product precursor [Desulfospira joergensenii]
MGLQSAKLFVKKMKENPEFRDRVKNVRNREAFQHLVREEKFDFDETHLAGAMASCMAEGEKEV